MEENRGSIIWETYEYEHEEKTADWFWAVGIVVVAGAVAAYLLGNVLFAVVIIIGGFSVALVSARHPDHWVCDLSTRGLRINQRLYPFSTIESFWVEDNGETGMLFLKSKKALMPEIVVPLEDINPDFVREFLIDRLEEEEMHEPLSHQLMRYLGF